MPPANAETVVYSLYSEESGVFTCVFTEPKSLYVTSNAYAIPADSSVGTGYSPSLNVCNAQVFSISVSRAAFIADAFLFNVLTNSADFISAADFSVPSVVVVAVTPSGILTKPDIQ